MLGRADRADICAFEWFDGWRSAFGLRDGLRHVHHGGCSATLAVTATIAGAALCGSKAMLVG